MYIFKIINNYKFIKKIVKIKYIIKYIKYTFNLKLYLITI